MTIGNCKKYPDINGLTHFRILEEILNDIFECGHLLSNYMKVVNLL